MKKVFFDESGNTGQNLLDEADPIFVLGSCSFGPEQEQRALSHFQNYKGKELKFSRVRQTPAGQRAVLAFLSSPEVTSQTASAYVIHKPFMVVTKYCDLVLEPSFRQAGVDFYARGANIASANFLTTTMPFLLNKSTWFGFLSLFVRVVRGRTPDLYDEWRKSAELIYNHLEHSHHKVASLFAPILLIRDRNDFFNTLSLDELDPIVPAYPVLANYWGSAIGDRYEIIADDSKPLARARGHLISLSAPDLKPFAAGYDRRKMEYPLKVSDIVAVDSTLHRQVQLADIVCGALTSAGKARMKGALRSGTFAHDVFDICFTKKLIVGGLWPSSELDPSALGTNAQPGPADVDLPTYSAMIFKGHPATKKDGQ